MLVPDGLKHTAFAVEHIHRVGHSIGVGSQARFTGVHLAERVANPRPHPEQGDHHGRHQHPGGDDGQPVQPPLGAEVVLELTQNVLLQPVGQSREVEQTALQVQQHTAGVVQCSGAQGLQLGGLVPQLQCDRSGIVLQRL
ncbi:hypothetical protein Y695_03077 [Hydrogenophaga sp. T4]|nr:hypothetical protein Y695_03077 [Hydrogenophaga sp. T4]